MSARLALLLALAACSTSLDHHPPDAARDAAAVPASAAGIFRVWSVYDLAAPPEPAKPVLAALADATDDPDDPGRYLVERMIAALPDGTTKTIAVELEPLLAACVQAELSDIAPRLVPGFVTMARDLGHFARHFGTSELWRIELSGATTRVVRGLVFDGVDVAFDGAGLADQFAATRVALDRGELAIADHELALPYGALLRLALDRAIIPSVDPGASDLARALRDLVDCRQLGIAFARTLGFGPDALYAAACDTALTEAADDFYARLAAIDASPLALATSGTARAVERDGDGNMDGIEGGAWAGALVVGGVRSPLGAGTFSGTK